MAIFPPPPSTHELQLLAATRSAATASLAGGIIAASGRPWSLKEAMALLEHVQFAMFPNPKNANYKAWQATADSFNRVYK
jgi:hypothetical protein